MGMECAEVLRCKLKNGERKKKVRVYDFTKGRGEGDIVDSAKILKKRSQFIIYNRIILNKLGATKYITHEKSDLPMFMV